jgi:predicted NBD/HSP70 family sugar kinase
MRKIDPIRFRIATKDTAREINRRILLNLVRTNQPISRADLARVMGVRRGAISLLVGDLLKDGLIYEGATGKAVRGRKPTFLYIESRRRMVVAVDIRASQTYLMPADLLGKPIGSVIGFPTVRDPRQLVAAISRRVHALLEDHHGIDACEGIGVVVPGMVEHKTMRVLHAPTLGWRNVDLREPIAAACGLPVQIENSGRACALALLWTMSGHAAPAGDLVFVSVSDGVGTGVIIQGELLRGRSNVAGEFGHAPLSLDGPRCSCGATGCWEAYISNRATLARYLGRAMDPAGLSTGDGAGFTIDDLIAQARTGDVRAATALQATGRYIGLGLATVINGLDPVRVFIGGEIIGAWDLIESAVRDALLERALTPGAASIEIQPVAVGDHPRLRGAAALVTAPAFAAPVVA